MSRRKSGNFFEHALVKPLLTLSAKDRAAVTGGKCRDARIISAYRRRGIHARHIRRYKTDPAARTATASSASANAAFRRASPRSSRSSSRRAGAALRPRSVAERRRAADRRRAAAGMESKSLDPLELFDLSAPELARLPQVYTRPAQSLWRRPAGCPTFGQLDGGDPFFRLTLYRRRAGRSRRMCRSSSISFGWRRRRCLRSSGAANPANLPTRFGPF